MFREYLNEIKTKAKAVHGSKPLWNGKDYLDSDGDIDLRSRNLTELPCVFPEKWEKGFYCNYNQLTTLEGAPKKVEEDFGCDNNQLTSLEGAPGVVGGDFLCYENKLTSLADAPRYVGGRLSCTHNQLTTLEGAPEVVGGNFDCTYNTTQFIVEDVKKACNVGGKIYV